MVLERCNFFRMMAEVTNSLMVLLLCTCLNICGAEHILSLEQDHLTEFSYAQTFYNLPSSTLLDENTKCLH